MKKTDLSLSLKVVLIVCNALFANISLLAFDADSFKEPGQMTHGPAFGEAVKLQKQNVQRAKALLEKLYIVDTEYLSEVPVGGDAYVEVGTQVGYYSKEDTTMAYSPLVIYRRVWVSDAGAALSFAVQNNDPTAHARALWLRRNGQYTRYPENPGKSVFAGWPFSSNQKQYGDNWTDCRFVTGANACALMGLANYITAYYMELSDPLKAEYQKFYADALSGILYLIETSGPNEGLVTAGWSLNVLEEFSKTNYSYNKILDMLGYGPREIEGFNDPIKRVRVRHVVTEHCIRVLTILNYSLIHYDRLFEENSPISYDKLESVRTNLQQSIFNKLYDKSKCSFIAGRLSSGEPNTHSYICDSSQLSMSLRFSKLNKEQVKALSDSLVYTINNFTKDFEIQGESYFGACHYEEGFDDAHAEKSYGHSDELQVEAVCVLVCGLIEFAKIFPEDPNVPLFRNTAERLWKDLQRFVNDNGFVYSSNALKDQSTSGLVEASSSAIWYLTAIKSFEEYLATSQTIVDR